MKTALFWWADNAGAVWVITLALVPLALGLGYPSLAWAIGLVSLLSLMQGLNNLFRRAPTLGMLVGFGIPALATGLALAQGRFDWSLLTFWIPGFVGLILEPLAHRQAAAQGILLPGMARAKAAPPVPMGTPMSGFARGCLWLIGLGTVAFVAFVVALNAPVRHANAFKAALRPGMSPGAVAAEATRHGRHLVFVRIEPAEPSVAIGSASARVGSERAEGPDAMRTLLDRHAGRFANGSASFMFLTVIPVRSSIVVNFGPDGRVSRVDGPYNRAD